MNRYLKAGIAAGSAAFAARAVYENTAMLQVASYRLPFRNLPRIVQLSDLHRRRFGRHQERLIRLTKEQNPEIIVITGDLVSRCAADFTETGLLIQNLCAIAPVLTVCGNHEADLPSGLFAKYRRTLKQSGAVMLDNRILRIGGIYFAGAAFSRDYYRGGGLFGFTGKKTCTAKVLRKRFGKCPPGTVLLAHNPLWFPAYAEWGAALTLSGHVHGGAVRLPLAGGILSPERTFFPRYDKGLFKIGSAAMIVSGGLGKPRLFNPPEICVISAEESSVCSGGLFVQPEPM
ncbi:MAG: metallophosphoesterase [Oscillospiraceae bacterium]|nr:metallophosphoesterase [Oscillospiraceae bacterium]